MRSFLFLGLIVVTSLVIGCGGGEPPVGRQPEGKPVQPGQEPGAPPAKAQANSANSQDWLARYDAAWKDLPDVVKPGEPASVLKLSLHFPSAAERTLLTQLSVMSAEQRIALLQQLLATAKTRIDLPIEYAAHAAVGGDAAVRTRVIQELLAPALQRSDLTEAEKNVLYRLALELEAVADLPELTEPLGLYLLAMKPAKPIHKDASVEELLAARMLMDQLTALATRVPESHQHALLSAVAVSQGFPPPPKQPPQPAIRVTSMPDGQPVLSESDRQRRNFISTFESSFRPLFEDRGGSPHQRPLPLSDAELAALKSGAGSAKELYELLMRAERNDMPLTAEERQAIGAHGARKASAAPDTDLESLQSAVRLVDRLKTPLAVADSLALAGKVIAFQTSDYRVKEEMWWQLQKTMLLTPKAEGGALVTGIAKLSPQQFAYLKPEFFALCDADSAKNLIRELAPKLSEKEVQILRPLILLADQTSPEDRERFHTYLLTRLRDFPEPANNRFNEPSNRLKLTNAFTESAKLSPAVADELLKLAFPLVPPTEADMDRVYPSHSKLIAWASPPVRKEQLDFLVTKLKKMKLEPTRLNPINIRFVGKGALTTLGELSPQLSAAEAQAISPAVVASFAESPKDAPELIAKYFAGRPLAERADLVRLLGTEIGNQELLFSTASSKLIDLAVNDLPPAEAAPALTAALAKSLNRPRKDSNKAQLLTALAKRIPPAEQAAMGTAVVKLAEQSVHLNDLLKLVEITLQMPGALNDGQRLMLATKLNQALLQEIEPTPPAAGFAPGQPPPPPFEAPLQPKTGNEPLVNPLANDSGTLSQLQRQLARLIEQLPAEKSLPIVQRLVAASVKLNDKIQFSRPEMGQPNSDRVLWVLPILASYRRDYPPADLSRLTGMYLRFLVNNRSAERPEQQQYADALRGTLPVGDMPRFVADLLTSYDQQVKSYGRYANAELSRGLKFLGDHVPSADAEACALALTAMFKNPPKSPGNIGEAPPPPPQQAELIRPFAEKYPIATATRSLEAFSAELTKATDPAQKQYFEALIVATLKPIAQHDPKQLLKRLESLSLSNPSRGRALSHLGSVTDQKKLADALFSGQSKVLDLSTKEGLMSAGNAFSSAPLTARISLSDAAGATGKYTGLQLFPFVGGNADPPQTREQMRAWLGEPDRVGVRRFIVLMATRTRADAFQPTLWTVLQP